MADAPAPKAAVDFSLIVKLAADLPEFAALIAEGAALIQSEKAALSNVERVKLAEPFLEAAAALSDKVIGQVKG